MATKVYPDKTKAEAELAKARARIKALEEQWTQAAPNGEGRYQRLSRAEEWVREGYGQDIQSSGPLGSNKAENDRKKLRAETMPDGRTRDQWISEYRQLKVTVAQIEDIEYPDLKQAPADKATTVDDKGRLIQQDPVTGADTAYNPATGKIEGFDAGLGAVESLEGSKPRALTNDDLEDIWRTSNPDITPDYLSKLYPEYNDDGTMQINEANPLAFSDPDMIRWDRNPNYASPAEHTRYRQEMERILGERRGTQAQAVRTPTGFEHVGRIGAGAPSASGRVGSPSARAPAVGHGGPISPGEYRMLSRQAQQRAGMSRTDVLSPKETTYSFREAFDLPFTWSPTQVSQMATRLFQAGYMPGLMDSFDPTKPLSEQYPGSLSDPYNMTFRGAYMQWMKDSMANRDKTSMQILGEREKSNGEYFSEMRRIAEEEKAKDLARRMAQYTQLTDPDRINSLVDQLGQALIGRKLSPSEKSTYVALIHSQQSAYGAARAHAEVEGTGLTQTEVDVQATLEAQVKADNPVEAMGKDVADQYNEFRKLLGGPLAMM